MIRWLYKGLNAELCGVDTENENTEVCGAEICVDLLSTKHVWRKKANMMKHLTMAHSR